LEDFQIHRLGWKAFQDLCVAIAEEQTNVAVQTFLPTRDAGRDGAFIGRWDGAKTGNSTIQCKFTSKPDLNLTLSMLSEELPKAQRLAKRKLADDYVLLTNHTITGASELKIRTAFEAAGVGRCRVFHRDWIVHKVTDSARLRMMVPRLYGLMDLGEIFDRRAYRQAQLILSEMGDNLQKLVVTEAHRKSVRAINRYNVVLLLGSPAAGKSTIGASLALGANDMWRCRTIKATSPEQLERHLDPSGGQFFWIDDAWGSTQFQRDRVEAWNQVFSLMQGALKKGTRFLITSRDYIWKSAKAELKLQAFPILSKSQVVIDVHDLTLEEKARILYNHLKLGDQDGDFKEAVRPFLPEVAKSLSFLPETARRLGAKLFTEQLRLRSSRVLDFFENPKEFLEQTIEGLSPSGRSAIALVFLNGGTVRSPVPLEKLRAPAETFGADASFVRTELNSLNGSLLNLAEDENGPYWTYRHPTIGDAFASHVARNPELVELYLRGAKPETILQEVVCAGVVLQGAPVTVPTSLSSLLIERIADLNTYPLVSFICYRANKAVTAELIRQRPDLRERLSYFSAPLREDLDVDFAIAMRRFNLLTEEERARFVECVRTAAVEEADDSFVDVPDIGAMLTETEYQEILQEVRDAWLDKPEGQVARIRKEWSTEYAPEDHFDRLKAAVETFTRALSTQIDAEATNSAFKKSVDTAVRSMLIDYEEPPSSSSPIQQSRAVATPLDELFRDVHE
jgi:hypothetical protein